MRFLFPHSHAFRKGRVTVIAEWLAEGDSIRLTVPDYRATRGTLVTARTWRLAKGKDEVWRSERLS